MLVATITQQRSGSKFLASVLRQQFNLIALGEIFNPESRDAYSYRTFLCAKGIERALEEGTAALFDDYFISLHNLGRALHFDIMFNQLDWPVTSWNPHPEPFIFKHLRAREAVVLSLVRNARDLFLSTKTLEISGQSHVYKESGKSSAEVASLKLQGQKARLDLNEYAWFGDILRANQNRLRNAFAGYPLFVEINYEDLQDPTQVVAKFLRPMRVAAAREAIPMDRKHRLNQHVDPIHVVPDYHAVFENVDELT